MSKINPSEAINGMIGPSASPKNERIDTKDAFAGIKTSVIKPAASIPDMTPKVSNTPADSEKKRRNGKQKANDDNLKRLTFWGDERQWEWIADYAYTTRQSVKDVMYQIIEDFQSSKDNVKLEHRPIRRPKFRRKK